MDKKYLPVNKVTDTQYVLMVREIFSTITCKYDFLNHLLSLRRDAAWRRFAVRKMRFSRTNRFLDVATGTSDLAVEAAIHYPHIKVVGMDFVQEMTDIGIKKVETKKLSSRIKVLMGDALNIPFPSDSFDVAGISFGIRNIPDKVRALRDMMRIVIPGGQVLVLEMTFPQGRLFKGIYHLYLNIILPLLARAFSPNPDAYYYLGDSIMNFPAPEGFRELMRQAGLINVEIYPLALGITDLYIGYKPASAPF